jgi:hypothetical protein
MPDNHGAVAYPLDLLGNQVKKNALVHVEFPTTGVICRVIHIEPVRLTSGENAMTVDGVITCTVQIPHRGKLPMCLVLKEPDESNIELVKAMPKVGDLVTQ